VESGKKEDQVSLTQVNSPQWISPGEIPGDFPRWFSPGDLPRWIPRQFSLGDFPRWSPYCYDFPNPLLVKSPGEITGGNSPGGNHLDPVSQGKSFWRDGLDYAFQIYPIKNK